jgi:hypothetical protein
MTKTVDVAAGQKVASTWGNEIRTRTVQVFATVAERDAQWPAPPQGALCVTIDANVMWRAVATGWSRLTPVSGIAAGPGGNYPVNADFISVPFAADKGPRVLSFVYNGLVTSQAGQALDIAAQFAGTSVATYRHPGNGATAMVNFAFDHVPIGPGVIGNLGIRPVTSTATLYADPLLHTLSYKVFPA